MSKKALYNLIRMNLGNSGFTLPAKIRLEDKTDRNGARYFLFELPMQKIRIADLNLVSHHVSVYESPTGKLDLQSQYHYTAFFESDSGEEYRLHAFFDVHDNMIDEGPKLSVLQGNKYVPVSNDDWDEVFADLAINSSFALVTCLRGVQNNRVNALQQQFKELESRLENLSSDQVKNRKQCLEVITSQILILDELSKISNKSPDIVKQMRWLIITKEIMESDRMQAEPVSELENKGNITVRSKYKDKEKVNTKAPINPKERRAKAVTEKKVPAMAKMKPLISADVAKLKLQLTTVVGLNDIKKANLLSDMYRTLKEKEWQVEFKERSATAEDLKDLRILKANIEKLAIDLLKQFLVQSDFNNAKIFKQFYPLLPEQMLSFALQMNRPPLLDFLLEQNIVAVNSKNLVINDVAYSSLVDYVFYSPGPEASKIACLDVLIKRGVSLMEIDKKSGLPYSALLLSNPKHPLRKVLEQNQDLTLNNADFYIKMNKVLRTINPASVTTDLDELIANNKERIVLLRQKIKSYDQPDKKLELSLGQELAHQIENDPEISYQSLQIKKQVALLLPKIALARRKKTLGLIDMNFVLLASKLNGIEDLGLIPPFEDIKRETLKLQFITLEYISLIDETLGYGTVLNRSNQYAKKEPKPLRKIKQRLVEMDERVAEIQFILNTAYNELLLEHATNFRLSKIQLMSQQLSGIYSDFGGSSTGNGDVNEVSAFTKGFANTFFAMAQNTSLSKDPVPSGINDIDNSSDSDEQAESSMNTVNSCMTQ